MRQQGKKQKEQKNWALADFITPKNYDKTDYIGGFAVSAGFGVEELVRSFEIENDDYNVILVKALADRLAEAFAEHMHERVRREFWGYAAGESLDNKSIIKGRYQGIRPAPGYPACPDHSEKVTLFKLLEVEKHVGSGLTESFAMSPAASVAGWFFRRPKSRYFGIGKIGKDQAVDYAKRKATSLASIENILFSNLAYPPQ